MTEWEKVAAKIKGILKLQNEIFPGDQLLFLLNESHIMKLIKIFTIYCTLPDSPSLPPNVHHPT